MTYKNYLDFKALTFEENGKLMKTEHFINTDKEARQSMANLSQSPLKIIFTKE